MDLRTRAATRADVTLLADLDRRTEVGWWGREETEDDEVRDALDWAGDLDTASRLVFAGDRLVGYALVLPRRDSTLTVDPDVDASVRTAVRDDLLGWLRGRAEALFSPAADTERLAALTRHGFAAAYTSFDLVRPPTEPLPAPVWPADVVLRPFDLDRDALEMHALVYSVWTDVPGHHDRSFEDWRTLFLGSGNVRPEHQVLAERDGRLVGVALGRIYAGTDGWVMQLAVGRDARGIGLGRALLLEALRRLGETDGVQAVGLSVNASNALALGLYRSVGLVVEREVVTYEPVRDAPVPA